MLSLPRVTRYFERHFPPSGLSLLQNLDNMQNVWQYSVQTASLEEVRIDLCIFIFAKSLRVVAVMWCMVDAAK
jgi:hypothetical protein